MPLTYPRSLPASLIISASKFKPMYQVAGQSRTLGGATLTVELGDPYWDCEIEMQNSTPTLAAALQAWEASLRGGQKTFLAHHHARPRPSAYATDAAVTALTRAGGGAFDGTARVTSFPTANQILINGSSTLKIPAGLQLRTGDMIGLVKVGTPNKYFLHQVMADVTADGSGVITIDVEPRIFTTIFSAGDTINFIKPLGEFVLTSQSDGKINWRDNSFEIAGTSFLV